MKPDGKYTTELKVSPSGEIEGWGIPFGGPIGGDSDVDGERFSSKTDFRFEWFPDGRPMLYDHGTDRKLGLDLIGRQTEHEVIDDVGVWVKGQLNMSHRYAEAVMSLIGEGKIGFSSLAMRHLIEKDRKGNILTWPWIEETLTVHPANPVATIEEFKMATTFSDAMKQLGLDIPDGLTTPPDPDSGKVIKLPEGMSTDDLRDAILVAAKDGFPSLFTGEDTFPWVNVIYDGKAIVTVAGQHYEIAYKTGTDGAVTVSGAPTVVVSRQIWEPESKTSDSVLWTPSKEEAGSFIDLADMAKASLTDVEGFIGNAESLVEAVRGKDEQLTDSKRAVLTDLGLGVRGVADRLDALLAEQNPNVPGSDSRPSWRARSLDLEANIRELTEPVRA